ncbi:MAG: HD domain-containing protein [Sutterella wadsworthensis]
MKKVLHPFRRLQEADFALRSPSTSCARPCPHPSFGEALDADLPLFTPQAPVGVVTAQALVDTCRLYLPHRLSREDPRSLLCRQCPPRVPQIGRTHITHPIAVASILASWRMDAEMIEAGLMHDVLEDTGTSKREILKIRD